jgi:ATP-dependent RNA helicase RhlE
LAIIPKKQRGIMSLETLGLSEEILQSLKERGYKNATSIQTALIPAILKGRDIMAGAQTGTGKTAGFALPILQKLSRDFQEKNVHPKAIIIVPTKELARQVHESFISYGRYLPLRSVSLYGGVNIKRQTKQLNAGVDIIVATSGRLLEHINAKHINVDAVRYLVLDEADTILDMGFLSEISKILTMLPSKRQNILISATLSGSLKRLAKEILHRPELIEVDTMGTTARSVQQVIYPVSSELKMELLSYLIGSRNYHQVLVFVRKKQIADEVCRELTLSGLKSSAIHGDKSSGERTRALKAFKEGKIRVLVATDIAARGIDIPLLEVVINYDTPHVTGDFIHRIGRTGRAGRKGLAITLISPQEEIAIKEVERLMGRAIERQEIEGYTPKIEKQLHGARKKSPSQKRTDGAFGKKKSLTIPSKKKRKVTKRDAFKAYDASKSKEDKKKSKRPRRGRR